MVLLFLLWWWHEVITFDFLHTIQTTPLFYSLLILCLYFIIISILTFLINGVNHSLRCTSWLSLKKKVHSCKEVKFGSNCTWQSVFLNEVLLSYQQVIHCIFVHSLCVYGKYIDSEVLLVQCLFHHRIWSQSKLFLPYKSKRCFWICDRMIAWMHQIQFHVFCGGFDCNCNTH